MTKTHLKTVAVVTSHDQPKLSKAQQTFNNLVKQIEKKRVTLSGWETAISAYQQKYSTVLLPLVADLMDSQVKMVYSLDRSFHQKGISKAERGAISDIILNLAEQILSSREDVELEAVYNKHCGFDNDVGSINEMKSELEEILGMELGDDFDLNSPELAAKRIQEQMDAFFAQLNTEHQAQQARQSKRKKSAKQLAKEALQQAEAQEVSLSIREVYRKLVSTLHPDREPDLQERERKTALMQRVNQAYEKKNLLLLLKLQLELEQIDPSVVNNISEERLKHYNIILRDQLAELDQEVRHVENDFLDQYGLTPFMRVSPNTIMRDLTAEIANVKLTIREINKDLHSFEDIKKFKSWLKEMRRQAAEMDDFDDCPF
jgi:hypothetical protein